MNSDIACGALIVMAYNFARFIRNVKPKYIAVAFDANSNTFRKKLYPLYKAQRDAPPPDLIPLFNLAPKLLNTMGCRCFIQDGYEADDIMATIGKWSRERGLNVVHVSIDKDMLQLIDTGVHVMNPFTLNIQGPDHVIEKYGVPPESLIDLMTLMGDSADNIPGVKGIGPKIASALIKHYGTVDNMYMKLGLANMKKKNDNDDIKTLHNIDDNNNDDDIINDDVIIKKKKKKSSKIDKDLEHIDVNQLDEAIKQLEECLQSVKATPNSILKKLLACEFEELTLFQHLFKLRSDIRIAGLYDDNGHHNSRILNPIKDKFLDKTNIYPIETLTEDITNTKQLSTYDFRYIGERNGAENDMKQMSESLLEPLELLRQQYHKLER
jgi:5'-3' exonuclease